MTSSWRSNESLKAHRVAHPLVRSYLSGLYFRNIDLEHSTVTQTAKVDFSIFSLSVFLGAFRAVVVECLSLSHTINFCKGRVEILRVLF